MPLGSWDILKALRGSESGLATYGTDSLGEYLTNNFGASSGDKSWSIELMNLTDSELLQRQLPTFRIGMYERSTTNLTLVEDYRVDFMNQSYGVSIFQRLSDSKPFDYDAEQNFYDLKDVIIAWSQETIFTTLTLDGMNCPTIFNFTYISENTIRRDYVNGYISCELIFNARRTLI